MTGTEWLEAAELAAAEKEAASDPPRSRKARSGLAEDVWREVLPNGLTMLLKRSERSPVVAIVAWFKVGYFHEADHESGMAHLLEHMFFKGSRQYPGPDDIGRAVRRLGGVLNAGTIYDRTSYYFVLPADALEPGLSIMADAVMHPLFEPEELRREIEVIVEESNRKRDNPSAMSLERTFELALDVHRMRRWRIGSDEVLRSMTREALVDFHERLYRPANLVLSIVGDLDPARAAELARALFSSMPTGNPRRESSPPEPPSSGVRSRVVKAPLRQALLEIAFRTPGVDHPDHHRLALLAQLLGGSRSSRLQRVVRVEEGLVRSISCSAYAYEDIGFFHIRATLEASQLPQARRAILSEVERLRRGGVRAGELEVARNLIDAGSIYQLEEVRGMAQLLAYYEVHGDFHDVDRVRQELLSCQAGELRRVANEHLDLHHAVVLQSVPEDTELSGLDHDAVLDDVRSVLATPHFRRFEAVGLPETRLRRIPSARRNAKGMPEVMPLSDGGTLILLEENQLPLTAVGLYFRGGRNRETAAQAGLSRLSLRSARHGGAGGQTADVIQTQLEALGAGLELGLDEEFLSFRLGLPSTRTAAGLSLLLDILTRPQFDPERLEREREGVISGIRQSHEQPARTALDLMHQALFGVEHPLGNPSAGHEATVARMGRDEVIAWYQNTLARHRRVVVVAGDVRARAVADLIQERLQSLRPLSTPQELPPREELRGVREAVETRAKQQTAMALAFPAPPPDAPEHPALVLLMEILSGSGGRLYSELRGRQSLAYSVGAFELGLTQENALVCTIAGDAAKEQASREGILRELDRLCRDGVSAEEVARAQAALLGRRAIGLQTLGARAGALAWAELKGVGVAGWQGLPRRYQEVTAGEVIEVARRYLVTDRYAIGIARGIGKG